MAGSIRNAVAALLVGVALAPPAEAFGGRFGFRSTSLAPCPTPVWCCYVPVAPPCWAYPVAPAMPRAPVTVAPVPKVKSQAEPRTAPPSRSAEPPLDTQRAPTITESRSFGGVTQAQAAALPAGRCNVGFWNITGADVTVTIDGQARSIPKDRAVTIVLDRSFAWQMSGRALQNERVPDGQSSFEVILRP